MGETDTETVELTRDEAREVINALSHHQSAVSGRDEERALNVREFLQREFEYEERHFQNDSGLHDAFADIFSSDEGHEVQLSRAEAREVISALADLEADSNQAEAETIATIRNRFEETFDLGGSRT